MATAPNPQMAGEQGIPVEEAYGLTKQALQQARPDAAMEMDAALGPLVEELATLENDDLDRLLMFLQRLYDAGEESYAAQRAALIQQGMADEEDLPAEYDPEFLAAAIALVLEAKRGRQSMGGMGGMPEPQGFAQGGIVAAARRVAGAGRNGDTMLAHVTPREAQMLKQRGGAGSINPRTGLPEFFIDKLFKSVGRALKKVFQNPIGRVLGTVGLTALLGPFAGAFAAPAAAGLGTALAGGNVKDVFRTAAFSFLSGPSSPLNEFLSPLTDSMGLGSFSPALAQGVRTGIMATGAGLLTGSSLKDAVREGMMMGAIQGASEALLTPGTSLQEQPKQAALPTAAPAAQATTAPPQATAMTPAQPAAPQAAAPPRPAGAGPVPVGQAMRTMGAGLGQMAGGQFSQGLGQLGQGARDLFMPGPPDSMAIARRGREIAQTLTGQDVPTGEALKLGMEAARKELTPSTLRQYGPAIAGGLGLMGLAGGFKEKPAELTPLQRQMQEYNEAAYARVRNNPRGYAPVAAGERFGLKYDEQGNIIGSEAYGSPYQPWWMENRAPRGFSEGGAVTPPPPDFETDVEGRTITTPPLFNPAPAANREQMMAAIRVPSRTLEDVAMGYPAQQATYWRERNQARLMGTPFTGGEPPPVPRYAYRLPREGEVPPPSEPVTFQPSPITRKPPPPVPPDSGAPRDIGDFPVVGVLPPTNEESPDFVGPLPRQDEGIGTNPPPDLPDPRQFFHGPITAQIPRQSTLLTPPPASTVPSPPTEPYPRPWMPTFSPPYRAPWMPPRDEGIGINPPRGWRRFSPPPDETRTFRYGRTYENDRRHGAFPITDPAQQASTAMFASGGIADLAKGGYPRKVGAIDGPGTETSDSIPAMLSDGEFVMTAKAVRGAGGGSRREGAKRMYALMHKLERNAARG